jgi:hypothetical protein
MINEDRPSIENGLSFFQSFFDGDKLTSPNKLAYLFFPLYRKNYTDEERLTIIKDNDHHTEGVSVVALFGLNDLNSAVHLNQGTKTTIRHLLLAIPAQTSTNKLFLQIERQPSNQWFLCCFYTTDATKVTLRLGALETLLKRYVKQEDHPKLFHTPDFTIKFDGQAAPVKKGRTQKIIQEAPEATTAYAKSAIKKLRTLNPKRLAVEFDESTADVLTEQPPTTVTPAINRASNHPPSRDLENSNHQPLEVSLHNQNNRLTRLEKCCGILAQSTKDLQNQLANMNDTMHAKMNEMAASIAKLSTSPNLRHYKSHKPHDSPTMDLDL